MNLHENIDRIKDIMDEGKDAFVSRASFDQEYDDVEVGGPYFSRNMGIIYDETYEEKQIIEFYNPVFITVERFTKEVDGAEYDYDDFYLGSFQVPYEELTHSLINEIFHLMITKI